MFRWIYLQWNENEDRKVGHGKIMLHKKIGSGDRDGIWYRYRLVEFDKKIWYIFF